MNTSKIAGLIVASMLAAAPVALAGGFGDIKTPTRHLYESGGAITNQVTGTHSPVSANFYTPANQPRAKHWSIRSAWQSYPLGFTLVYE